WTPEACSAFLAYVLAEVMPQPHAIVAAGHAAGYVLKGATAAREAKLVLLAPTWRGPLPTMLGGDRPWFDRLCRLVDRPALGPLIYGAETPPRSRAEMEALAALPKVRTVRLPRGKLAFYEEFPDATAEAVEGFLQS